jgi:hypothetical protein
MRPIVAATLLSVTAAAAPSGLAGQGWADRAWSDAQAALAAPPTAVAPTLLSLTIPGAGQHVLGQDRKWLYLGLEVVGWALWVERRASARDYRDRYRDYAWETGRIQSGSRVDGDFDYYERLTKWSRSGAFDADAGSAGVQPEPDPSTYNGSIWSLAAQMFLPLGSPPAPTDPAYQDALLYYQERAYGPTLLWDWTAGPGDQEELSRLIGESDSRFGQATTVLGAVIANHILSAADAYLSARGRTRSARLRVLPASPLGAHRSTLGAGHSWEDRAGSLGRAGALRAAPGAEWLVVLSIGVGR